MISKPLRVLVVQDDFRVGQRLAREICACGEIVVGPFSTVDEAMRQVDSVHAAILDLSVHDEDALCVADRLMHSDVPFVFVTARGAGDIPARFDGHRAYPKPRHAAPLLDDLHRQHRTRAARHDDDPKLVVVEMLERSRMIMPDPASAERLVEAALLRAVAQSVESGIPPRFRFWLMGLLDDEIGQKSRHLQ
ncbi:response regulator [Paracoccus sediminis]|uniref:Response regulator n=1 Tax=Paracoccus sediminis TaxID=1214787 RepID=A0A238WFA7_9RHOB|nr:response regulator [Paracoccus sediminis]TBN50925.1 response regulator [Paracoccus sediminis]SNR44369.1 hypothetical protein SAMN06265378_10496 [Paracoccus sediminis]